MSELASGVATSMAWSMGDFESEEEDDDIVQATSGGIDGVTDLGSGDMSSGDIGSGSGAGLGRRLDGDSGDVGSGTVDEAGSAVVTVSSAWRNKSRKLEQGLYGVLRLFGCVLAFFSGLHALGVYWWRYCVNTKYYEALGVPQPLAPIWVRSPSALALSVRGRWCCLFECHANGMSDHPPQPPPELQRTCTPWTPSARVHPAPPPGSQACAYATSGIKSHEQQQEQQQEQQRRADDDRLPLFRPLPAVLVFPNLPLLAFWCFTMGLSKKSTSLLAFSHARGGIACGWRCELAAMLTLALCGFVVALGLAMLLNFSCRHRKACWKPKKRPTKLAAVDDPLFRQWSRVRACFGGKPVERVQGAWAKPKPDMAEPARTERLLAHGALNPFYARASDCLESMAMTLMTGSSGHHLLGQLFAWLVIVLQVTMGVLSGVGPYLEPGSAAAQFQVLAVGFLKCAWATLLICCIPHASLLMNMVLASIFVCEGISVVLLWYANWGGASAEVVERIQLWSFLLLLLPVFLPIVQKLYDAIIVNIIVNCVRKKFDWGNVTTAMCNLLFALPTMLAKVFGISTGRTGGLAIKGAATVRNLLAETKTQRNVKKTRESKANALKARGEVAASQARAQAQVLAGTALASYAYAGTSQSGILLGTQSRVHVDDTEDGIVEGGHNDGGGIGAGAIGGDGGRVGRRVGAEDAEGGATHGDDAGDGDDGDDGDNNDDGGDDF